MLLFSLVFIGGCASVIWLNTAHDTFAYVIAGLSGWASLSFLFLSFFVRVAAAQEEPEDAFWFYSGGAPELRPVVDGLKRHTSRVRGKASLLFIAENGQWNFKAGYNCSPGVGASVAQGLATLIGSSRQEALPLQVVDGAMTALCTPFSLTNGLELLLVSLHDANAPLPSAAAMESCHAAVSFGWMLGWSFPRTTSGVAGKDAANSPVCCAVCDRLQNASGGWVRWDAWMHERERMALSHTICPECADWAYAEPASPSNPPSRSTVR